MAPPNRLRHWRTERKLTQEKLGARIGKSKSLISLWENGERALKMHDALTLCKALEVDLNQLLGQSAETAVAKALQPPQVTTSGGARGVSDLPVRGYAQGGGRLVMLAHDAAKEHIERPSYLQGVDGAFALYVSDTTMIPALRPGWTAHIHPGQHPRVGDFVLIELNDGQGLVKELVRENADHITVCQYTPKRSWDIPTADIKRIYRIKGVVY